MKKHAVDLSKPCAVQQWNALIALNYVAKNMGIKRSMTVYEALCICPDLILIHVSTVEVPDEAIVIKKQKHFWCDADDPREQIRNG